MRVIVNELNVHCLRSLSPNVTKETRNICPVVKERHSHPESESPNPEIRSFMEKPQKHGKEHALASRKRHGRVAFDVARCRAAWRGVG